MVVERQYPTIELGELRTKLDQMTERIVSRLKDRMRFPLNKTVYQPDGVSIKGRSGISLLQFAIEGLEAYHASLGRFDYPDQYPILGFNLPQSSIERVIDQQPLPKLDLNLRDDLISFYLDLLSKYCSHGDNPATYGGTVYVDATLLELIHERINLGRYVAESKARKDPTIYQVMGDDNLLLSKLRDIRREGELISEARGIAKKYESKPERTDLAADLTEHAFRWMIDKTIFIEIAYIRQVGRTNNKER